ncbi:hypothetical protein ACLOJK_022490 [Asimina triloba]
MQVTGCSLMDERATTRRIWMRSGGRWVQMLREGDDRRALRRTLPTELAGCRWRIAGADGRGVRCTWGNQIAGAGRTRAIDEDDGGESEADGSDTVAGNGAVGRR